MAFFDTIIYHNPRCSTSRATLNFIRSAGIEPHVIEYLKTPPTAEMLEILASRMDLSLHDLLRTKEDDYKKLGLDTKQLENNELAKIMHENPHLIERPIVVTPLGVRLCRPAEKVVEILIQDHSEF